MFLVDTCWLLDVVALVFMNENSILPVVHDGLKRMCLRSMTINTHVRVRGRVNTHLSTVFLSVCTCTCAAEPPPLRDHYIGSALNRRRWHGYINIV